MRSGATIAVIIPAFNEEEAIGKVLEAMPAWVDDMLVVDNGSTDRTAETARRGGARVILEPRRGYGAACLAGIATLQGPDIVVFLDGDFSDYPEDMAALVDPIIDRTADFVIGSRSLGAREPGAFTPQARFGNWLACSLMRLFWGAQYTDLGPFRAIRRTTLDALGMQDRNYGWTVEMQIKAIRQGVRTLEVPVRYRKRIGRSKISGTLRGIVGAGTKILFTIFRYLLRPGPSDTKHPRERLMVFTRYPQAGQAKTRLIPALGAEGAAALQCAMTAHTLHSARRCAATRPCAAEIQYAGGDESVLRTWLGADLRYCPQRGADLGERLRHAFEKAFLAGADRAVIIGTDSPELTDTLLAQAFDALHAHDLVLGPAQDGGYYLIGLRAPAPALFEDIPWSTDEVFSRTLAAAEALGLTVAQLPVLHDVDRPEDLEVWERAVEHPAQSGEPPPLSVIVPTLNEVERIAQTIAWIRSEPGVEVIVADGGSTDGTPELATTYGAVVVRSSKGRARQMNTGAQQARGNTLLFLHADTMLPHDYGAQIEAVLSQPDTAAGAFRLRLDADSPALRLIAAVANKRAGVLGLPYGDQGLFLRRALFEQLGGFPDLPILEDYEMIRRIGHIGPMSPISPIESKRRIRIAPGTVTTSARRWLNDGLCRTTLRHWLIIVAYRCGVSPARLVQWR